MWKPCGAVALIALEWKSARQVRQAVDPVRTVGESLGDDMNHPAVGLRALLLQAAASQQEAVATTISLRLDQRRTL